MVNETAVGQIIGREVEKLFFETDVGELGTARIRLRPASTSIAGRLSESHRGKSMKNHFWLGVVSKAHVMKGVEGGFAQLNHGKKAPLAKMKAGDWIVYYSPRLSLETREPYQHFTALGRVKNGEVYQYDMGNEFMPYRLDVDFASCREISILPLLNKLSFTQGKKNWGQQFRFGHFEISESDFLLLANEMGVNIDSNMLE